MNDKVLLNHEERLAAAELTLSALLRAFATNPVVMAKIDELIAMQAQRARTQTDQHIGFQLEEYRNMLGH